MMMTKRSMFFVVGIVLLVWFWFHKQCASCQQKWSDLKSKFMGEEGA